MNRLKKGTMAYEGFMNCCDALPYSENILKLVFKCTKNPQRPIEFKKFEKFEKSRLSKTEWIKAKLVYDIWGNENRCTVTDLMILNEKDKRGIASFLVGEPFPVSNYRKVKIVEKKESKNLQIGKVF